MFSCPYSSCWFSPIVVLMKSVCIALVCRRLPLNNLYTGPFCYRRRHLESLEPRVFCPVISWIDQAGYDSAPPVVFIASHDALRASSSRLDLSTAPRKTANRTREDNTRKDLALYVVSPSCFVRCHEAPPLVCCLPCNHPGPYSSSPIQATTENSGDRSLSLRY